MSDIIYEVSKFQYKGNDPAYRIYTFNGTGYEQLMILRYNDIESSTLKKSNEASDDFDIELNIKDYYNFQKVLNEGYNKPLLLERMFSQFDKSKDRYNELTFVTAIQNNSTIDDGGIMQNEFIVQSMNLLSLMNKKLWWNNKFYPNPPKDDQGNIQKPEDYMYYIHTTKNKIETVVSATTEVFVNGRVPNGRKVVKGNNAKLKGISAVNFVSDKKAGYAIPGNYNFECGDKTLADKLIESCSDFNYFVTLDSNGKLILNIERNAPKLIGEINWRYSKQKPISLIDTHDFHETTSGVYITNDKLNDQFYTELRPYMHTTFDAKSDNSDNSDGDDQATDLLKANVSKVDSVDFEYSELDKEPFTELILGQYVKYVLNGRENIYVITGFEETLEGIERTVNYSMEIADEDISNKIKSNTVKSLTRKEK